MNPETSIIMSVYNNCEYLEESINSILNQTYTDFEFIITNDGSKDKTLGIISEFAKRDKRIVIINNKQNIGLTKSLNNMINIAKGRFIARMDGDDIAVGSRLENQLSIFRDNPEIDVIFTDTILIDEKSHEVCKSWRPNKLSTITKYLDLNNFIPHPTVVIKSSVLKKYGYNEKYITGQDAELWTRMHKDKIAFYYLKKNLLLYRINPNSVRKNNKSKYYNLANGCINNNCSRKAIKYLKNLKGKDKLIIIIKLFIPFKILLYKGLITRKLNKSGVNL